MRRRLTLACIAAIAASGCSSVTESGWEQLDDISYVVPSHLPSGWTLAYATERPGRPIDEWESQSEQYTNEARDEVVIIAASHAGRGEATKPGVPTTETEFSPPWLLAYFIDDDVEIDELKLVQTTWRSATLDLAVMHLAPRPSARLVRVVAAKVEDETNLGFTAPAEVAPGFTYAGGAGGEVTDYTIVFAPNRYAGTSRKEATKLTDDAPTIGINVGAHFYAQWPELTTLDKAKVQSDGRRLEIEFVYKESWVRVGSDAISRQELLAVAKSVKRYGLDDWRRRLGSRLLTQDPPD